MKNHAHDIRRLSLNEEAFTISNEAYPLCVVCVLHLDTCPKISDIETALVSLQSRHPLLNAAIEKRGKRFYFKNLTSDQRISLRNQARENELHYKRIVEILLNTKFDINGPLMNCHYLRGSANSELVVCFHHAIIDGNSARLLLHEFLSLIGEVPLETAPKPIHPQLPKQFRSWRLFRKVSAFLSRQLKEDLRYKREGLNAPIPQNSWNRPISINISTTLSRKIIVAAGRKGFSLNTILLAAITLAYWRQNKSNEDSKLARIISFVDMRANLDPPLGRNQLGAYFSMIRLCIPLQRTANAWDIASLIKKAIFKSSRRGEVFLMANLSKLLIKMALQLQNDRIGVTALSFIGTLDLQPQYGIIGLKNVEAYITNNRLGPQFSAFGKVLFGRIGLDFTYLKEETTEEEAKHICAEVLRILDSFTNNA